MKKLLLAGVGFAALAGAAMAADIPMRTKAPAYAPPFSWTGCYIGAHFGSLFSTNGWTTSAPFAPFPTGTPESSFNTTDLLGGIQGSCDYQADIWVLGVQGDGAWTQGTGTAVGNVTGLTDRTKITSLSSVTGRLGVALDRWLPYVKGGGAWTTDRYDAFLPGAGVVTSTFSGTRSGWTVGGGMEYAIISNLSMFIEYDWYDFGTKAIMFSNAAAFPAMSVHERDSVVKVGANWKLWPW